MSQLPSDEGSVLVVGGTHIDVFADYPSRNTGKVHHTGQVKFAVGGAGYNIAVGLAHASVRTYLLSVVREGRFSSIWIKTRLKEAGVNLEFLQTRDRGPEGGFIAIRKGTGLEGYELVLGVTATSIESAPLSREVLEEAVKKCSLVVAECNLSEVQLTRVVEAANRHERPILVGGVSECKARRILVLDEQHKVDVFSLNEEEFLTIEEKPVDDLSPEDVSRICRRVRSRYVFVTRGNKGYTVMTDTGQMQDFPAPEVENCASSSGAGDALLAGVAAHWLHKGESEWEKVHDIIKLYVSRVLKEEGASPGAITDEIDYPTVATTAEEEKEPKIMEKYLQPWAVLFGGIGGIATVLTFIWVLTH